MDMITRINFQITLHAYMTLRYHESWIMMTWLLYRLFHPKIIMIVAPGPYGRTHALHLEKGLRNDANSEIDLCRRPNQTNAIYYIIKPYISIGVYGGGRESDLNKFDMYITMRHIINCVLYNKIIALARVHLLDYVCLNTFW